MAKRGMASKLVRDYLMQNPEAKPKEVAEALKKHKVTPNLVSNIKSRMKHGLDAVSVAAVESSGGGSVVVATRRRPAVANRDSDAQLRAAADLIRKCGSLATARATLDLVEEITSVAGR